MTQETRGYPIGVSVRIPYDGATEVQRSQAGLMTQFKVFPRWDILELHLKNIKKKKKVRTATSIPEVTRMTGQKLGCSTEAKSFTET